MTREADLERVRREGKRVRSASIEARVAASPLSHPRIGIVVPRHGHTAVLRNRVKRRMREIVRTSWLPIMTDPVDIVLRALPPAYEVSFAALREQLDGIFARLSSRRASDA